MIDFEFSNHGSLCLLIPRSEEAEEWVEHNLEDNLIRYGDGIVVEPRYVAVLLDGLAEAGLCVSMSGQRVDR